MGVFVLSIVAETRFGRATEVGALPALTHCPCDTSAFVSRTATLEGN